VEVRPGAGHAFGPGVDEMLVYDYVIFAGAKVSDDVVAKVVAAMYENPGDMKSGAPLFKEFDPRLMSKDLGIAYHPGAIKFFQTKGIWPGAK
jgi:TRAP-type uncharacterized transport system substrate-binding protein